MSDLATCPYCDAGFYAHEDVPAVDALRRHIDEHAIVPDYLRRRVRVAEVFRRYIAQADAVLDSPRAAILEALCAEVLDVLDDLSGGEAAQD